MQKINKIKRYSEEEIKYYSKVWIINGCWWKGWINFSEILEIFFEKFENYKTEKNLKLWLDIEYLCKEHDLDYHFWKWFRKSNFIFAFWVFKLIKSWTSFSERFLIFFIIYFLLNKYWKKYYELSDFKNKGK